MTTVNYQISLNTDDADQHLNQSVERFRDFVILGDIDTNDWTGLRFQGVTIPVGATIDVAYLQFYAYWTDAGGINQNIWGEDGAGPGTFTAAANNIGGRARTAATILWVPGNWNAGNWYNSGELKTIIQELVDNYDYSVGAPMVILQKFDGAGSNERGFHSHDDNPAIAAKLHIEFTEAAGDTYGPKIQVI